MNESGNRGGRLGRKEGRSWSLPRAYLPLLCQLPGPTSCWSVTLSSLILHTQEPEDEGPLLTETGCFGNPGQGASGLLGNTWETCLPGWREVGWPVSGQAGWRSKSQARPLRTQAYEEGLACGIAWAACWPFSSKPEPRGPGGLPGETRALMGQPKWWAEMG